jgi:hypothetical protein
MIIGDESSFAIESTITHAYAQLSLRALGFFVIHIGGRCYGVRSPDATMLACSLGEVEDRIARRGKHTAPFAAGETAGEIADAYRDAIYAPEPGSQTYFGIPRSEFRRIIHSNHLIWAPDGDEAFDDGSHVLHFDVGHRVRLIGFKCIEGYHHDPSTLSDKWLDADVFYGTLDRWRNAFAAEWAATPKK